MRHIDLTRIKPPREIESENHLNLINKLLKEEERGEKHNFNEDHIKSLGEIKKDLYNDKCGYCETPLKKAGYSVTIDHYRPKGRFKDGNSHPGYFWLAYEWTNMVPACQKCNRAKSNYFPIKGIRVTKPPMKGNKFDTAACKVDSKKHRDEKPLLLHPEINHPEEHLVFMTDGRVEVKKKSLKAEKTIEICKLNRRVLVQARRKFIMDFYNAIKKILYDFLFNGASQETFLYVLDNKFKEIQQAQNPKSEYSRLGWFLFHKFDEFFIKRLKEEYGEKEAKYVDNAFSFFRKHGTCRKKDKKEPRRESRF